MIDNINAEPDYGDEPPIACSSSVQVHGGRFACGGTPGHAGKHTFSASGRGTLPKISIEWDDAPAGILLTDHLRERGNHYAAALVERAERKAAQAALVAAAPAGQAEVRCHWCGHRKGEHSAGIGDCHGTFTGPSQCKCNGFTPAREQPQAAPELAAAMAQLADEWLAKHREYADASKQNAADLDYARAQNAIGVAYKRCAEQLRKRAGLQP